MPDAVETAEMAFCLYEILRPKLGHFEALDCRIGVDHSRVLAVSGGPSRCSSSASVMISAFRSRCVNLFWSGR